MQPILRTIEPSPSESQPPGTASIQPVLRLGPVSRKLKQKGDARSVQTRKHQHVSPSLKKAWVSALTVSERDVETYVPTVLDMRVAEAFLAGCHTSHDIADYAGVSPQRIWSVLRNQVAAAWVAAQVQASVKHRMGMVVSALFAKAVGGDVGAAKVLLERFGQLQSLSHVVHHKGMDVSKLSDADLDLVLSGKLNETGVIIDVKTVQPQTQLLSPAGRIPQAGGPDPLGEPVRELRGGLTDATLDRSPEQRRESGQGSQIAAVDPPLDRPGEDTH